MKMMKTIILLFSQENILDSESGYGSAGQPPGREEDSPSGRRARLRKSHSTEGLLRSPQPLPPSVVPQVCFLVHIFLQVLIVSEFFNPS